MNRPAAHSSRAALLLEVVVALTVLVTAMGFLCAQLAQGLEMSTYSEGQFRAGLLADRMLEIVRLEPQMRVLMDESEELEYAFTDDSVFGYPLANEPGYFWRVTHEPVDKENEDRLRIVTIQILHQLDEEAPDELSGAQVVRELVLLQAQRPTRDLAEETGLSEDQIEQLRQQIPIPGFDPHAVDMQLLMSQVDEDLLAQYLPVLMPLLQQFEAGGMPDELSQLAGQFGLTTSGTGLDAGALDGSAEELANMIREAAESGQVPGLTGGGAPGGGRRGRGSQTGVTPRGLGEGGRRGQRGGATRTEREPAPAPQPQPRGQVDVGRGSGPNGEYTIEDLMRLRDEYERQQRGGL